jgi:hypothetical protein
MDLQDYFDFTFPLSFFTLLQRKERMEQKETFVLHAKILLILP